MRVLLAGATGAIGRPLVPMLLAAGHEVLGTTRSQARAEQLRAAGAEPVVVDALDSEALAAAVRGARPEAVIEQLTAIPPRIDPRRFARDFELTDRLRTEATETLVRAAVDAGARRIVGQSVAFFYAPGTPGTVHSERDPLVDLADTPSAGRRSAEAIHRHERTLLDAGGVVLRYGYFYGPGTAIGTGGSTVEAVRKRGMPIVGDGGGVWSLIHIEDAARATLAALEHGESGAYNIVDDEPARVGDWVPELARVLGAPAPRRVPAFIARLAVGAYGVAVMTRTQGASNALAASELGWRPQTASWREGFRTGLG